MFLIKKLHQRTLLTRILMAGMLATALALSGVGSAMAQDKPAELSLITPDADAGFALAVKLSQKGVGTVQSDAEVRKQLRPAYSHDADSLIAVSQVIAIHFQTVAAANNYWRD